MSLKKISGPKKPTPVKKTSAEVAAINGKYLGKEPSWMPGQIPTRSEKAVAFTWYSYMGDRSEAKSYAADFYRRKGETALVSIIESIPENSFPTTVGWLARMDELGADVSESFAFMRDKIDEYSRWGTSPANTQEPVTATSVTIKRTAGDAKTDAFIAELEKVVDRADWKFSVYDSLKREEIPTSKVYRLVDYYAPLLDEIRVAIANSDIQVFEGYRRWKKQELKAAEAWLVNALDDCGRYGKSEKNLRAPRKKKPQSVEKKLKHFVFMKESQEYRVASVDPSSLIGAARAILFNVKYKAITVLVADQPTGLSIKGKSVVGFSEANSWSCPMGRKAAEAITAATQGTAAAVLKNTEALKKGKNPWPRVKNLVDGNTLLLRTISR